MTFICTNTACRGLTYAQLRANQSSMINFRVECLQERSSEAVRDPYFFGVALYWILQLRQPGFFSAFANLSLFRVYSFSSLGPLQSRSGTEKVRPWNGWCGYSALVLSMRLGGLGKSAFSPRTSAT